MSIQSNCFSSETELVETFCQQLLRDDSRWACVGMLREFNYQRGRTDIIAKDSEGRIIAFEAKRSDWRTAVHQAYRNTCFADFSYVILPEDAAIQSLLCATEYELRSVGLIGVEVTEKTVSVRVHIEAPSIDPLQPWLHNLAASSVEEMENAAIT